MGAFPIEGVEPALWPTGSVIRRQGVSFTAKAWQAIGGQAANSSGAMKYLLKQIEELVSSRAHQPAYIQWTATADPAGLLNASELHDGWYIITDFSPNYAKNVVTALVQCRMTVAHLGAAAPRRVAMSYQGAALSSNFSGAALNLVATSIGSTFPETSFTRAGGEGSIPSVLSPVASPEPVVLPTSPTQIFQGGVHVYDSIA